MKTPGAITALLLLTISTLTARAVDNALRDQVNDLFKRRQWAEAQAELEKVTAAEPANAAAWHYLGQTFLFRKDAEKAVPPLEKAVGLEPRNSEYQRILGDAYGLSAMKAGLFAKMGWARKCKAAYDAAVQLDPGNIAARFSVMEYCRQAPGFMGGGMEQAYVQAAEIKKLDPARGRQAYATLYVAEKKYTEAFALYEEVLREKPGDNDALFAIGRLADISGQQLDRGLAALRELLTHEGKANDPRTHTRIGYILEKKGDPAGARAAYEAALVGDSKYAPALEALKKL